MSILMSLSPFVLVMLPFVVANAIEFFVHSSVPFLVHFFAFHVAVNFACRNDLIRFKETECFSRLAAGFSLERAAGNL